MAPEDLTPADRERAQVDMIRRYLGRSKRDRFDAVHIVPARMRYDMAGRVVSIEGQPVAPRMSTWDEDRA